MTSYDTHYTYLLQFGFHPVAVVGRLVQKWEKISQKDIQNNTKSQNTQNGEQKYKTKIKCTKNITT